jgi:predicted Fe-S protein YdhL (DUF1289 family)
MNKRTSQSTANIQSPCVNNCCLDENDICLGCFRSIDEIMGWYEATNEQKVIVLTHCEQRRKQNSKTWQ